MKLALTRAEAAEALGMSVDSFERYLQGQVRLVRLGRLVLMPVTELERVVFDEHYQAGWLVSEHAREILRRREAGWKRRDARSSCYADPSIIASHGLSTRWGQPASVLTEYREHGVNWLVAANHDRAAGYSRLLELLHVEPGRLFPAWHPRFGERGAPRLFVASRCAHVIEQLKSAPVAEEGPDAGKAIDAKWEHEHGHACAALRYGAMSGPGAVTAA